MAEELNQGKGIADRIKEIKDANGDSTYHLGALHGSTEICQYSVEDLGFHVDFLTARGETLLFHAAMGGHAAIARYRISHGANPVVPDKEGQTPLHSAARDGHNRLVKYLLSLGVLVDITVNHAVGAPLIMTALSTKGA